MNEIKYGSFKSEAGITHFHVVLERDNFHVAAGFANYGHSCHFSDVGIHFHKDKNEGDKCVYSPTGFCNCYDQIKWTSYSGNITDKTAVNILIDRLEKALNKNESGLTWAEKQEMYEKLNHTPSLWDGDFAN